MAENRQREAFKKLSLAIIEILEKPEWIEGDVDHLYVVFFEQMEEVLKLAFKLNITSEKLKEYVDKFGKDLKVRELLQLLSETMENSKTYTLLNYYAYRFMQAYVEQMKQEFTKEINGVLVKQGLTEEEIKNIERDYKDLITQSAGESRGF